VIDWLVQEAEDRPRPAADLPVEAWLSSRERLVYSNLRSAKRREDWILGRWTAKQLVEATAVKRGRRRPRTSEISILAAKDGAPEVWLGSDNCYESGELNISISHSQNVSFCAVAAPATCLLGADIEAVSSRRAGFAEAYFTDAEIEAVHMAGAHDRRHLITAIWSGKEAALKAVREGLRLDTRSVDCTFIEPFVKTQEWRSFRIKWHDTQTAAHCPELSGWYRFWSHFVLTIAVSGEADRAAGRH
jgi:4'-phosphopantetheinyl transferase